MAIPTVRDWGSEFITEAKLDEISAALNFLLAPPRVFAYKDSDGQLGTGTWSGGIALGAEAYDSHNTHDNTTDTSRVGAAEAGLYALKCGLRFEFNSTGSRRLQIRKNAAGVQTAGVLLRYITLNAVTGAGNDTDIFANFDVQLAAGDYVELFAQQTSGGPLNIKAGLDGTFLSLRWCAKTV